MRLGDPAPEVVELYRARWQVELLFKRLKSQGGLDTLECKREARGLLNVLLSISQG